MKNFRFVIGLLFFINGIMQPMGAVAQKLTQNIIGYVYDIETNETLPFATLIIQDSEPIIGVSSDSIGNFILKNVPVGRCNLKVEMLGYQSKQIPDLLVTSGREIRLNIGLYIERSNLDEIKVSAEKSRALNSMATLSARQFTVEETQRYAGGMDDPARLVSAFAGVATPSVSSNGISVRGNNPDGLLWLVEGVEVPSPNHFANLTVAGGGLLTAISSQMMGNSDFFTGGFPAEYGNALSGVFDIQLQQGSQTKRQYTFQAGVIGIDVASNGPIKQGKKATYNFNYRNSTMALVAPILPSDAGILKYQDLAFKTHFPTKKAGSFTLWGLGAYDATLMEADDSTMWETDIDRDNSKTQMYFYAGGLSHKVNTENGSFIKTTLSVTGSGLNHNEHRLDYSMKEHPQAMVNNQQHNYTIQTAISKRLSKKLTFKTGGSFRVIDYQLDVKQSLANNEKLTQLSNQNNTFALSRLWAQGKYQIGNKTDLILGVNGQYLSLDGQYSVEPRVSLSYSISQKQRISAAVGQYSRMEQPSVYFVNINNTYPNKKLDFMQSLHAVLSYQLKINDYLNICVEPYYQQLAKVPVNPNNYISSLNNINTLFFYQGLENKGKGYNVGIDLTLERYMKNGFYYLITASLFDSKYKAKDNVWRNTRFNRNYVLNVALGKEWMLKKDRMLSINSRFNYLGGNRIEAINIAASKQNKSIVYGETGNEQSFSKQFPDLPVISFTLSYRKNKPRSSSIWALQIMNLTKTEEFSTHIYNYKTNTIDTRFQGILIPNLSYKVEF